MYNTSGVDTSQIQRIVARFQADKSIRSALSTTEQIVLALVFNKPKWLPKSYTHPARALYLLGENWTRQVIAYHIDTNP